MASTPRLHDMGTPVRVLLGALIGAAVALLLLLLRPTHLFESLELRFIDARTEHFLAQRPPDPRIVLAEIQEDDVQRLKALGPLFAWPWSLDINAMAFRLMAAAGVDAIAVDVLHLDQGAFLDDLGRFVPEDEARIDGAYIRARELANELRAAYEAVGGVTLGFELTRETAGTEVPARVQAAEGKLEGDLLCDCPRGLLRRGANLPVSRLTRGAKNLGFVNVPDDGDGVVRRAYAMGRWGERPVPSLALATAALAVDGKLTFESGAVRIGDAMQRLNDDGSFLVRFLGEAGTPYARVAPADMLAWADELDTTGEVPAEARDALEGKIVVWGVNLAGHDDVLATPISGKLHGPEFQATAIDNLLHGDGRVLATPFLNAIILFVLAIGLGAGEGVMRGRLAPHLVPVGGAAALLLLAYVAFGRGLALDLFTPVMALVLTWGVTSVVRVMTEGRRRRWLEGTFGRYLAPSIIQALKENPDLVKLGGRRKEITILFSDVAGFTRISEQLAAPDTVTLLNRYLTVHTAAVLENGGVVDKFEGDAVMAFFGDPVPTASHAVEACRAALVVFERLPQVEPVWREMGLTDFSIRIGINTGTAVVGNMGSDQRFDYTCMGDAVNLASRLEGANKAFESGILIGSCTFEEARDVVLAKPIAGLVVVGRSVPEPVYQLIGLRAEASEDLLGHVEAYTRGHGCVLADDLDGARAALEEAGRLRPEDGPTHWLEGIVDRLAAGDLERPWDGVVKLTGK